VIPEPVIGQPNNEIWYTTVDESIIETTAPIDSEWGMMFGTKMVSNTYENGIGIMKFEDDLTFIGPFTFTDNQKLKTIILPSKITRIETYDPPFNGCTSLISIVLPDNLEYIGDWVFWHCSSLTSITIPNSVTNIGREVFKGCSSLTSPLYNAHCFAYMPTSYSGAYTIPEGIEQIAGGAFSDCSSFTSVTIPNSVTSIGDDAFYGCSSLNSIIFEGTIEEWNSVSKGVDWNYNVPATYVQCSDGQVTL
jgi:hypothetical protein